MAFKFLRGIFKEKETNVQNIKIEELSALIDSWTKNLGTDLNLKLSSINNNITDEKEKIKSILEKLSKLEIQNKEIPRRAEQIMEGNRRAYLQKLNTFLNDVNLPENFNKIQEFYDFFDNTLLEFGKSIVKNHYVLQEFFGDEVEAIDMKIHNLTKLIEESKKIVNESEIEKANKLRNKLEHLQQKIKQKQELKKTIKTKKEELGDKLKKTKDIENKIKSLEIGKEYANFIKLSKEIEKLSVQIEESKKQITEFFSTIRPALKKYEKITIDEKIVNKYVEEPICALVDDKSLKIIEILGKIKEAIVKNELVLKDTKKKRIINEINNTNKGYFNQFLSKYEKLTEELNNLESEIKKVQIIEDIDNFKEKLKKSKLDVEKEEKEIDNFVKTHEKINIENLKENLEKDTIETMNKNIKII